MKKKSSEQITENIYFLTLHSYLLQRSDLKENYNILLDQYTRYPESFRTLTKNDILRIKRIQDDIENNQFSLFSGPIDLTTHIPEFEKEKSTRTHKELCNNLISKNSYIESITGPLKCVSREHPTFFGPIDIMAQTEDTAFIIEVKTEKADHAIIGQVKKYYLAISLKLILRHFDNVKIITICPGYDKASYLGLKQIGATILLINTNTMELKELRE